MNDEGMSGRRYREERARIEAQQAEERVRTEAQQAGQRLASQRAAAPAEPQEITMSRKTAFQMGLWAAVGATVWFAIVLPIILFVLFVVFGLSLSLSG